MEYEVIDPGQHERSGMYRHFTEDAKCSLSMTARLDVTELAASSKRSSSRFYINFLYLLAKALNSQRVYRMGYLPQTEELICWNQINPTQYVFFEETKSCSPVYTLYDEDYEIFYARAAQDLEDARLLGTYNLDMEHHPNWFDASYLPWVSYDAFNIELPDGHLFFNPIINWGAWHAEGDRLLMPLTVRLNHAVADGYAAAAVYRILDLEMRAFIGH